MPINKYKSFVDAQKGLLNLEPGVEYYKRVREFFELLYRLNPPKIQRKIFKYRNIVEANENPWFQIE